MTSLLSSATIIAAHGGHGPYWGGPGPHWGGPGPWWILVPILWLLLVGTAIALFARFGRRRWHHDATRSGEARLAERYAAGEIDETEYERRLATLKRLAT